MYLRGCFLSQVTLMTTSHVCVVRICVSYLLLITTWCGQVSRSLVKAAGVGTSVSLYFLVTPGDQLMNLCHGLLVRPLHVGQPALLHSRARLSQGRPQKGPVAVHVLSDFVHFSAPSLIAALFNTVFIF